MYKVSIQEISLGRGEIGKEIGEPVIREYEDAKKALKDLDKTIDEKCNSCGNYYYTIIMPDGRNVPLNTAYFEIFGEEPKYTEKGYKYPKLK